MKTSETAPGPEACPRCGQVAYGQTGEAVGRPPLGVMPRYLHMRWRAEALADAIGRCMAVSLTPERVELVREWMDELSAIVAWSAQDAEDFRLRRGKYAPERRRQEEARREKAESGEAVGWDGAPKNVIAYWGMTVKMRDGREVPFELGKVWLRDDKLFVREIGIPLQEIPQEEVLELRIHRPRG